MRSEIPTVVCTKNAVFWNAIHAIWLQILRTLGRNLMRLSSGFKVDAVYSTKECTFLLDCTWNLNQRHWLCPSVKARQSYCCPYCITNCVCSYNVCNKCDCLLMQSSLPNEVHHLDSTSLFLLEYLKSVVYVTQILGTATLKVLHISRN